MQAKGSPPPVGVIFDTALTSSEHVLALAALYKLQSAREARVASLSVSRSDLRTAALCDALLRFFSGTASRSPMPIGMPTVAARGQTPNAMAEAVLGALTAGGEPRHPNGIAKINDTADVAAVIRNGISAQQPDNGAVVIAGPLSNLAAAMALPDLAGLVAKRIRVLTVAVTAENLRADLAAARRVFKDWTGPVVLVQTPEIAFPGAELEARFAWSADNPVREAYQSFQKMPYDAPLQSAAAVLYAVRPESDLFTLSPPGVIELMDNGDTNFTSVANGKHRVLRPVANRQEDAVNTLVELITGQPASPARGGRGGGKQE